MAVYAGVDGAPGGWICAMLDTDSREHAHALVPDAEALFALRDSHAIDVMAIDIPIGLPAAGRRACDLEARTLLAPTRHHSVFFTPIRDAIEQASWEEANALSRERTGKGISKQAWNITPKIRDIDRMIEPDDQAWLIEIHPELCFASWAGAPMRHNKKTSEGKAERAALIDEAFGSVARSAMRSGYPMKSMADDDMHDAFAALFCAMKRGVNAAERVPADPSRDERGLLMEMWR